MPCDSSHMEATQAEREASRIHCLLNEVANGHPPDRRHWAGYHPLAYGKMVTRQELDSLTAALCSALSEEADVTQYSLELQMWWRDHQAADKAKGD